MFSTIVYVEVITNPNQNFTEGHAFYNGSFGAEERALDWESEDLGVSPDSDTHPPGGTERVI